MERVTLGSSGIEVTRLCIGSWNMAPQKGWGPEDDEASVALLRHALDSGCNFIDTAMGYGRGRSEEIVGKAVKGRRDRTVVATKAVQGPPEEFEQVLDTCLRHLDTDYVDLFICHWPRPSQPLEPYLEAMNRQKQAGKIRALGASNFDLEQMRTAVENGIVSLQPPLSILWRIPDELMAFCRESNVAITPYSPLAQGALTGRLTRQKEALAGPRKNNVLMSDENMERTLAVARDVDAIADRLGCASSQVALAWLLRTTGVTSLIVGASSASQWDENIGALDVTLPDEDYRRLDESGRKVWDVFGADATMWGYKPE
jgi:aryl-alcohol dehydrogenase-like predicted oxidoreductase